MEKRIGVVSILLNSRASVDHLNSILTNYSHLNIGRFGMPLKNRTIHVISLIVEGTTDEISAMTGKIGKLEGVQVKSVLTRYKEDEHADTDINN